MLSENKQKTINELLYYIKLFMEIGALEAEFGALSAYEDDELETIDDLVEIFRDEVSCWEF